MRVDQSNGRCPWMAAAVALGSVLGMGCPASGDRGDGGSSSSCLSSADCPQDMYCAGGRCIFGGREDGGGRDGTAEAGALDGAVDSALVDAAVEAGPADRPGVEQCVGLTCEELNKSCGRWDDGCGVELDCGGCGENELCNTVGLCQCMFASCSGACCPFGSVCFGGACCAPQCVGRCCGDDSCGGTCPDRCAATGQTCNSTSCDCEGTCVPQTCAELGKECGSWDDGCGGDVVCPSCGSNETCDSAGSCGCAYRACGGACCAEGQDCVDGVCGGGLDAGQPDSASPLFSQGTCLPRYSQSGGGGCGGGAPCRADIDCVIADVLDYVHCYAESYCVQCLDDSHCVRGINNTGKCYGNRCTGCSSDPDCAGTGLGPRCVSGTCRDCVDDGDCVAGPGNTGRCSAYNRCNKCLTNADCVAAELGGWCDVDVSYCFDCSTDDHCTAGAGSTDLCVDSVCDGCQENQECVDSALSSTCYCIPDDPSTTAVDEDTCLGTRRCLSERCRELCDSSDDDYAEPNDVGDDAYAITVPGTQADLVSCYQSDWFSFTGPQGSGLTVDLLFSRADADLSFTLWAAGTPAAQLASSLSHTDRESLSWELLTADTPLLIEVKNTSPDDSWASYALATTLHAGGYEPCAPEDTYEPNDTAELAADLIVPGTYSGLVACDSADWYAFTLPQGSGATAHIAFAQVETNLDLHIYRASDPPVRLGLSDGYSNDEQVCVNDLGAVTPLLLKVVNRGFAYGGASDYTLTVDFVTDPCPAG